MTNMGVGAQTGLRPAGSWLGKIVLITGASDGIGASCAKLMGRCGARLGLTALPSDEFKNEESNSLLMVAGDITSQKTRLEIVERATNRFGRIEVLINNAGVGQHGYPTEVDTEISKWMST
jgi:NAD(P)-dependent dehydrogenase (short-subunit alcohol dehydrogenase family)